MSKRLLGVALAAGLLLPPSAAVAEEDAPSTQFLGPFEFAPLLNSVGNLGGNLGAPRAASPETRLGAGLIWRRDSMTSAGVTSTSDHIALLLEGHLELFDFIEVGVDFEIFDHAASSGYDSNEFGFVTPRVKVLVLPLGYLDIAVGTGVLLPTSTYDFYESNLPVAFDPGAYIAYRPLSWLSVNATLPFIFWMMVPETGDTVDWYYFSPSIGVTAMPLDFIGGFVDFQFHVWMNAESLGPGLPAPDPMRAINIMFGARSRPLEWVFLEAGLIVPLYGEDVEDGQIGLGFRVSATPDFL